MNAKPLLLASLALAAQACSVSRVAPQERVERKLITGRTAVIAHRGGPGPDGTIAGVGRSLAAGISFVELDVRLTSDSEAVILHDPTVDRTTDGTGAVADLTLAQVRRLDAGAKYRDPAEPNKSYAGERIPTVREMIRFVGERGVILLELKVPEAVQAVITAIRRERAFHRVIVRSADKNVLRRIKLLDFRIRIGTMGTMPDANLDAFVGELRKLGVVAFTVPTANHDQVAKFRSEGIAVWGTNTNDPAVMSKLIDAGVDGIITDTTPVLAGLLKPQEPTEPPPPSIEDEEEARSGTSLVGVRGGLWMLPDFKSTLPTGAREITRTALFDVGVDFSLLFDSVFVGSSIDYALTNELSIFSFSAQAGVEADLGKLVVPLSLRASAGILLAELDVDEESFGDFDHGVGFLARVELTGRVTPSVVASLWVDYRHIEFDYEPTVVSGDDAAGGATFAVGLSLGLRF